MACRIALIDPNTNTEKKTITTNSIYRDAEQEVVQMNEKLNAKGNKRGLYWKVTHINI